MVVSDDISVLTDDHAGTAVDSFTLLRSRTRISEEEIEDGFRSLLLYLRRRCHFDIYNSID